MNVEFQRWPEELAAHYRSCAYWIDQPLTRILDQQRQTRPAAPAIVCGERTLSYDALDRLSSNLAARLAAKGLGPGDTALVQLPNLAEFYIAFFALLKAGIAPVNALYSHRRHEMTAYARQIEPKLLIASRQHELFRTEDFIGSLQEMQDGALTVLLMDEADPSSSLSHWIESAPDGVAPDYGPTPPGEVAFFQLSGGSTGTPKLIPRTHNDYDYSVRASAEICDLTPETRFLCALPAGHNFPLSSPGALGVFHAGGCVVLAPNPEPLACFELIRKHKVTMAGLVPSAVNLWLQAAPDHRNALESLELLQVGGAHFPESHARLVPQILGCKLQQVFGMAEGLVNYTRLDDPDELVFTTQGRPISPDDEIKIVGEDGQPVPDGETGRLATRGPYTFRGYFRSPEHNADVFDQDGFYYSGDLVCRTGEGYLRVVGRVKDQINRGGEKIAAEEVESLLLLHTDVREAALVAIQDPALGEKSCAVIVSDNSCIKPLALRRHLMSLGVADYKLPDRFSFADAIPLTAFGKPDKKKLRMDLAQKFTPALTQQRFPMTIPTISDYPMPKDFPANKTGWKPDAARAVFLIHDMQDYFLRYYNADGELMTRLIANLQRVRNWAYANNVPVIYTAQPHDQPPEDRALLNDMWGPGLTVADPALQQVVKGLEPGESDVVLTKWRYSAFQRSDLKARMASLGRDQLIVGGIYAHIGCLMTVADAFMNDIQAFMIGDAVADFSEAEHKMALKYVATRCGAVTDTASLTGAAQKSEPMRDWLHSRVLELIEDDADLDPEENLIFYGLDSIQVMKLASELKERGIVVGFDELARVPTLNGWWALIESKRLAA